MFSNLDIDKVSGLIPWKCFSKYQVSFYFGFQKKEDVRFWEAECLEIDPKQKKILCSSNIDAGKEKEDFVLDYDYLIIAMGARPNTFNTPGVAEYCHFLKVLLAFKLWLHLVKNWWYTYLQQLGMSQKEISKISQKDFFYQHNVFIIYSSVEVA